MSFLRAARAALVSGKCVRGTSVAITAMLLSAFFLSCGSAKLPAFTSGNDAYVTLPSQGTVMLLHIDGLTGAITTGAQTPPVGGVAPNGIALLSSLKLLYVANSNANTISTYKINSDSTLTLSGTPIPDGGTGPDDAVIDPSGNYLLVTNTISNNISVFSIDSGSGALTAVAGSPFYAYNNPTELLVLPSDNFVYVTNPSIGMVTGFAFDSSSGALTLIPGAPFFSGAGAIGLATLSGNYLYVANPSALNPATPAVVGNIAAFSINSTTGALAPIAGSPFKATVGAGPTTILIDPNSQFVFATTPASNYSFWSFSIDPLNGELTPTFGSPYSVAGGTLFSLIDSNGGFFYIGSQSANGIEAYTYDQNGAPSVIDNSPFSTGSAPGKMVIIP